MLSFPSRLAPPDLAAFFDARSVVVVGASDRPTSTSGRPFHYTRRYGYAGALYAVNPKYDTVQGEQCFSELSALPEVPDLAVVTLAAAHVPDTLDECAALGVRAAVVFANGFADAEDTVAQAALEGVLRGSAMRVLGPNCLGCLNVGNGLVASFGSYMLNSMYPRGDIALITQSGSIGNAILLDFVARDLGISKWVATGNEADLGVLDFVEYLLDDDDSRTIAVYAESFKDGARWADIGRHARELEKPIIVLKAGQSDAARAAVSSHSGKIAGAYEVWLNVAEASGIVPVRTLEELTNCVYAVTRAPHIRGARRVATVGTGGFGVIVTDACGSSGLELAHLDDATSEALTAILPANATILNPVDPTPVEDSVYFEAAEHVLADENVDILLLMITSLRRDYTQIVPRIEALQAVSAKYGKPLVVSYISPTDALSREQEREVEATGALVYARPTEAIAALRLLRSGVGNDAAADSASSIDAPASGSALGWLELRNSLNEHGIAVVDGAVVSTEGELAAAVERLGLPVVLKVERSDVAHKSDLGLVRVGLDNAEQVRRAFAELRDHAARGDGAVIVQQQILNGLEIIVGCRRDPEFGPIVTVGAGGIYTELLRDARSALCPVTADDARSLLARTNVGRILRGLRGGEPYDATALADLVARASSYFAGSELVELELNPVIVGSSGRGAVVVDVLATTGG